MINATFKLDWQGPEYTRRLHRELQRAVRTSAGMVANKAKELLNTSGKALTAKSGINSLTTKGASRTQQTHERFKAGAKNIFNLKEVNSKNSGKSMFFGGTLMSSKMGRIDRVYWYASPLFRWVQSSPPGTPPYKQTGNLQQIAIEFQSEKLRAKVGPKYGLKYARIQELGGKGMINLPPRPYLRPAFESQQQAIMFQFALAVARASK